MIWFRLLYLNRGKKYYIVINFVVLSFPQQQFQDVIPKDSIIANKGDSHPVLYNSIGYTSSRSLDYDSTSIIGLFFTSSVWSFCLLKHPISLHVNLSVIFRQYSSKHKNVRVIILIFNRYDRNLLFGLFGLYI